MKTVTGTNVSRYFFQKNIQGDVINIVDGGCNHVATYHYDAWGNVLRITDVSGNEIPLTADHIANKNPFRYRGYYYDVETNLYYLNARYYDPETGRFISKDDVDYLEPDSVNGYNLFTYCYNNPVMYSDPSGHWIVTALVILGTILFATGCAMIYSDITDTTMSIDLSLTIGIGGNIGGKIGLSFVFDPQNNYIGSYFHYGAFSGMKYNTISGTYSIGVIENYKREGDCAGPSINVGGGYYVGADFAYDPRQNMNNTLKVSSYTFGNSKGTYVGYDYYTYLGGWYL